jgi:probable HAF family extracellular repeat protein
MATSTRLLSAFFGLALGGFLASNAAILYTLKTTGGLVWEGSDINAAGDVVGTHDGGYFYNGESITAVGPFGGSGRFAYAALNAINKNRLMVGRTTTGIINGNSGPEHGFSYDPNSGSVRDLSSLTGISGASNARGINDANLIVGESTTTNGTHAVRFELNGAITDLGTLGGTNSSAADINEAGDIVGMAQDAGGSTRAFLMLAGGRMADLGTLGGKESRANRINNKRQIAGSSTTANGERHAFFFSDGQMVDLGTLGGTSSEALGLNEAGIVVGTSVLTNEWPAAFIRFPNGPMQDLGQLVRLGGDDILLRATSINDRGIIVATLFHPVYRTGVVFTVLLLPGSLSGEAKDGKWTLKFSSPLGTSFRLERSEDFNTWTSVLSTTSTNSETLHSDLLTPQPRFFRAFLP